MPVEPLHHAAQVALVAAVVAEQHDVAKAVRGQAFGRGHQHLLEHGIGHAEGAGKAHVPGGRRDAALGHVGDHRRHQRMAQIAMEVLGPYAQLTDYDGGRWVYNYLRSRGNTIEAGTSEIQRNIIAQRRCGLPR